MRSRLELVRALAIAMASPLIARLPPRRLARLLEPSGGGTRTPGPFPPLREVERALALSGRLLRHSCYTRGITRYFVLRRSALDVDLVFGLDSASGDGHCWLLLNGEPYREPSPPEERFVPVWRIPEAEPGVSS